MAASASRRLHGSRQLALRGQVGQLLAYALLTVLVVAALVPFLYMFFSSFKPFHEIIDPSPALLPKEWTVATYVEILTRQGFVKALWNTVWVSALVTAAQALTSSAAGYVFAKYRFPGKETLFKLLLATMMVPFAVVLIPLYIQVVKLNLLDNLWSLVLTSLCNTFSIFVMRQFMESVPDEFIEAARIDGAGEQWIYLRVVMPLALAPLTTVSVFTFLGQWDNYMFPSVVILDPARETLPLFLAGLRNMYWSRYDLFAAASMLTVVPVMIGYAFAQRTFVRGAQMSGLKG